MIDERKTFEEFGYYSADLAKYSHKNVWAICIDCNKRRIVQFRSYRDLCHSCASSGKRNSQYGKTGKNSACYGENHHNWNPNKTDEERINVRHYMSYYEWRRNVYKKDDYICQICKIRGRNLNAHHLDGYNNNKNKRTLVENGITLCKKCHNNFHHQYGYGNNTKEQFIEFKINYE